MDKSILKRIEALEAVSMSKSQYDCVLGFLRCIREAAEQYKPGDDIVNVDLPNTLKDYKRSME